MRHRGKKQSNIKGNWRICKPLVGSSILSPGTNEIGYFPNFYGGVNLPRDRWREAYRKKLLHHNHHRAQQFRRHRARPDAGAAH